MSGRRSASVDPEDMAVASPRRSTRIARITRTDSPLPLLSKTESGAETEPSRRSSRSQSTQEDIDEYDSKENQRTSRAARGRSPLVSVNTKADKIVLSRRSSRSSVTQETSSEKNVKVATVTRSRRNSSKDSVSEKSDKSKEDGSDDDFEKVLRKRVTRSMSRSPTSQHTKSVTASPVKKQFGKLRLSLNRKSEEDLKTNKLDIITENEDELNKSTQGAASKTTEGSEFLNNNDKNNSQNIDVPYVKLDVLDVLMEKASYSRSSDEKIENHTEDQIEVEVKEKVLLDNDESKEFEDNVDKQNNESAEQHTEINNSEISQKTNENKEASEENNKLEIEMKESVKLSEFTESTESNELLDSSNQGESNQKDIKEEKALPNHQDENKKIENVEDQNIENESAQQVEDNLTITKSNVLEETVEDEETTHLSIENVEKESNISLLNVEEEETEPQILDKENDSNKSEENIFEENVSEENSENTKVENENTLPKSEENIEENNKSSAEIKNDENKSNTSDNNENKEASEENNKLEIEMKESVKLSEITESTESNELLDSSNQGESNQKDIEEEKALPNHQDENTKIENVEDQNIETVDESKTSITSDINVTENENMFEESYTEDNNSKYNEKLIEENQTNDEKVTADLTESKQDDKESMESVKMDIATEDNIISTTHPDEEKSQNISEEIDESNVEANSSIPEKNVTMNDTKDTEEINHSPKATEINEKEMSVNISAEDVGDEKKDNSGSNTLEDNMNKIMEVDEKKEVPINDNEPTNISVVNEEKEQKTSTDNENDENCEPNISIIGSDSSSPLQNSVTSTPVKEPLVTKNVSKDDEQELNLSVVNEDGNTYSPIINKIENISTQIETDNSISESTKEDSLPNTKDSNIEKENEYQAESQETESIENKSSNSETNIEVVKQQENENSAAIEEVLKNSSDKSEMNKTDEGSSVVEINSDTEVDGKVISETASNVSKSGNVEIDSPSNKKRKRTNIDSSTEETFCEKKKRKSVTELKFSSESESEEEMKKTELKSDLQINDTEKQESEDLPVQATEKEPEPNQKDEEPESITSNEIETCKKSADEELNVSVTNSEQDNQQSLEGSDGVHEEVEIDDDSEFDEEARFSLIDDMASEGSEETPSIDSNEIIDLGDSVGSSEPDLDSDDEYEEGSFVVDDDVGNEELLSGSEELDELSWKDKPKRIIPVDSSSSDEDIDKLSMQPFGGSSPSVVSTNQISSIESDMDSVQKRNEELSRMIEDEAKAIDIKLPKHTTEDNRKTKEKVPEKIEKAVVEDVEYHDASDKSTEDISTHEQEIVMEISEDDVNKLKNKTDKETLQPKDIENRETEEQSTDISADKKKMKRVSLISVTAETKPKPSASDDKKKQKQSVVDKAAEISRYDSALERYFQNLESVELKQPKRRESFNIKNLQKIADTDKENIVDLNKASQLNKSFDETFSKSTPDKLKKKSKSNKFTVETQGDLLKADKNDEKLKFEVENTTNIVKNEEHVTVITSSKFDKKLRKQLVTQLQEYDDDELVEPSENKHVKSPKMHKVKKQTSPTTNQDIPNKYVRSPKISHETEEEVFNLMNFNTIDTSLNTSKKTKKNKKVKKSQDKNKENVEVEEETLTKEYIVSASPKSGKKISKHSKKRKWEYDEGIIKDLENPTPTKYVKSPKLQILDKQLSTGSEEHLNKYVRSPKTLHETEETNYSILDTSVNTSKKSKKKKGKKSKTTHEKNKENIESEIEMLEDFANTTQIDAANERDNTAIKHKSKKHKKTKDKLLTKLSTNIPDVESSSPDKKLKKKNKKKKYLQDSEKQADVFQQKIEIKAPPVEIKKHMKIKKKLSDPDSLLVGKENKKILIDEKLDKSKKKKNKPKESVTFIQTSTEVSKKDKNLKNVPIKHVPLDMKEYKTNNKRKQLNTDDTTPKTKRPKLSTDSSEISMNIKVKKDKASSRKVLASKTDSSKIKIKKEKPSETNIYKNLIKPSRRGFTMDNHFKIEEFTLDSL